MRLVGRVLASCALTASALLLGGAPRGHTSQLRSGIAAATG